MINFQLQLLPSNWKVDFWIGKDKETIAAHLAVKYGENSGHWKNEISPAGAVISTCWSIPDKENFILVYLEDFSEGVIIHEANHIIHHFGRITGMKWNYDSQELQSIYLEWLFDEIMKRKV